MNRLSLSRRIWAWGGLSSMLLSASVGCVRLDELEDLVHREGPATGVGVAHAADSQANPIVRAQSPDRRAASRPGPSHSTKLVSHEGTPVSPSVMSQGAVMSGGYPAGYCPPEGAYCPPGAHHGFCMPGIPIPGAGVLNCPPNYSYENPGVPVYPPGTGPAMTGPGSPGAIVQYPYYTTKGPDDFFLDRDGRY